MTEEEQKDEVAPIHTGSGPTTDGKKTPQEVEVEKENQEWQEKKAQEQSPDR